MLPSSTKSRPLASPSAANASVTRAWPSGGASAGFMTQARSAHGSNRPALGSLSAYPSPSTGSSYATGSSTAGPSGCVLDAVDGDHVVGAVVALRPAPGTS